MTRLRADYEHRLRHTQADIAESGSGGEVSGANEKHIDADYQVRAQVVAAERETLIRLREQGVVGDEAMHTIERELDLEEARLRTAH